MTEWRTDKPEVAGLYLITVKIYLDNKPTDVTTSSAHWHDKRWLGRDQDDVVAWAELPKPYREEQITMGIIESEE
jgi:hypothetical protein